MASLKKTSAYVQLLGSTLIDLYIEFYHEIIRWIVSQFSSSSMKTSRDVWGKQYHKKKGRSDQVSAQGLLIGQ
jgi:hypothetical protein